MMTSVQRMLLVCYVPEKINQLYLQNKTTKTFFKV